MVIPRNFIGYGGKPPKVEWPNGKRLALQIVVNYEGGGERTIVSGDKGAETIGESRIYGKPPKRDMANESIFEYETRVAVWRMLDFLDRYNLKITFFATAKTLEVNPEAAKAIVSRGHEICSHGYRWIEHYTMTRKQERESIKKTIALIRKITGERPLGWYCRRPSPNTIELLAEEGGFLYDSDVFNDDLPYYVRVHGKKFLLIPYTHDVNDIQYHHNRFANSEDFYQYLKDSFDYLHEESKQNGQLMSVGTHLRIIGRPGRIVALDRFVKYAKQYDDVWFARRVDIAKWWLDHYE